MLAVRQIEKPLAAVLKGPAMSVEQELEMRRLWPFFITLQEHPCIAAILLTGVFVPPHERLILDVVHRGSINNVVIGSRGTSKTSTVDVIYATVKSTIYSKRKAITLSEAGFRGGQLIFNDIEKMVKGAWVDQDSGVDYVLASIKNDGVVHRAQNFWRIDFTSESSQLTLPTNDPTKLRGNRAHDLYLDERNFMDEQLVDQVAGSFTNVLADMKTGGENAEANYFYLTTTVDYQWREFQKVARGAYDSLRREMDALGAAARGDMELYKDLERQKLHRASYTCIDYTDTIVRRRVVTRDGRTMEVTWPDETRRWRHLPEGLPYTAVDEEGRIKQPGESCDVITTYGINREDLEGKLLNGESSEPVWLSEQRNVLDASAGDVYPHNIVDAAVFKGGRYLIPWEECGSGYKKAYKDSERHFVPPVMWECTDPCVLGVDYAPGNRDFSAFVVIRIGPMGIGDFDPLTGLGRTEWSNVIWAEQHRNASGVNVAEKIRAFASRYNLTYFDDSYETDTWKLCRAIGLDVRGGGNAVRDELVFINKEHLAEDEYRILDPLDDDPRLAAFKLDRQKSKPMLDAIKPTGMLNDKLVEFTLGQLGQRKLFLPADIKPSQRMTDKKFDTGYDGARVLEHQLRALQQAPTASGYRKFYMAGDEESTTNKKDMWAAFIYAAKQLRAHLLRVRLMDDTPPPIGLMVTRWGVGRGNSNLAAGARRW